MYSQQTYEVIKTRTLDNINIDIDKREGSITNTMVSANSMSLAKAYIDMGDILSLGFIEDTFDTYLDKRVSEFGVYRKEGSKAIGQIVASGKEGTVIPNGTVFLCNDLKFIMLNDVEIGVEANICYVEAEEVGYRYNLSPNSAFTLTEPINGVESLTNEKSFENGVDVETDEELRQRFKKVVNNPSTSGNKAHYEEWALEVNGVGRAIVYPLWNGNGTVKVMVIGNDNKPVSSDIVENAKLHIEENMPIGCKLTVTTPSLLNVNIVASIELKDGYEISEIKEEFEYKLNEYLKTVTTELTYSKVYGILVNLLGVGDISVLTVNGGTSNITISEDKVVNVNSIELSEVV
jgi:uncharacterized phage protein gp47/JayE